MELIIYMNTHESVSDSDRAQQFQSENQQENLWHFNRRNTEFQSVQQYPETFQNQLSGDKIYVNL